jgi:molybdenum cofactor synthesis domain-containing protein
MGQGYKVVVLTASDKGAVGKRVDTSGAVIVDRCQEAGLTVVEKVILPDEQAQLSQKMQDICDQKLADLILTTGGTGLAPRDCTPEATLAIAERLVPGIAEALRSYSLQLTKRAMLGRGVAVIRRQTLIINLPGSKKAVTESLDYLLDQLPHALGLLRDEPQASKAHETT